MLLKKGGSVQGLTTAAGFWVTSAIGLAIGSGMYYIGLFTTALVIILQIVLHKVHIAKDACAYELNVVMEHSPEHLKQLIHKIETSHTRIHIGNVSKTRTVL